MSLVGPRPCLPYEYESYLPEQKRRFETLPGLTGLWQVSGKNKTTFSEMVALDVHYVENRSPWLDLKIMFKTLPALVSQVRAARAMRNNIDRPAERQSPLTIGLRSPVESAPLGGSAVVVNNGLGVRSARMLSCYAGTMIDGSAPSP